MTPTITIPCRVTAKAEAYVAELGLQDAFAQMLAHTQGVVPGLRAIEVTLQPPYDLGGGPCVIIDATMDDPHLSYDPTMMEWAHWKSRQFPPEVGQHFCFFANYGFSHAR